MNKKQIALIAGGVGALLGGIAVVLCKCKKGKERKIEKELDSAFGLNTDDSDFGSCTCQCNRYRGFSRDSFNNDNWGNDNWGNDNWDTIEVTENPFATGFDSLGDEPICGEDFEDYDEEDDDWFEEPFIDDDVYDYNNLDLDDETICGTDFEDYDEEDDDWFEEPIIDDEYEKSDNK